MIDTKQTENHPHLVDYSAFSSLAGEELNIDGCKAIENKVTYPIQVAQSLLSFAKKMSNEGIDVFNSKDPFFNDPCEPYYTEEGRDVIIEVRRRYYFKKVLFCDYVRIDYSSGRSDCSCEPNNPLDQFLNDFGLGNHFLGCYMSVFNTFLRTVEAGLV